MKFGLTNASLRYGTRSTSRFYERVWSVPTAKYNRHLARSFIRAKLTVGVKTRVALAVQTQSFGELNAVFWWLYFFRVQVAELFLPQLSDKFYPDYRDNFYPDRQEYFSFRCKFYSGRRGKI